MKTIILFLILIGFCNFLFAGKTDDKNKVKYKVTAVKKNENSVISESNIVEVNIPFTIYIPNAFTPNGDGLNDSFGISGEGIKEFHMSVFSKWGEMIFESTNAEEQWDGTYKGEIVQDGSYVYNINIRTTDQKHIAKNGTVTLIK